MKTLREFWESVEGKGSEKALRRWFNDVRKVSVEWKNFADLRATYRTADAVGDCVVFNIGGNKFRLVVKVDYQRSGVFIVGVMTHREYDRGDWKSQCGC